MTDFDPSILAEDRAAVAARIDAAESIRQAVAPRADAGLRGGQRRAWVATKAVSPVAAPFPEQAVVPQQQPKLPPVSCSLATPATMVTFRWDGVADRVVVTTKEREQPGTYFNPLLAYFHRVTMTRAEARAHYRKLRTKGFTRW